MYIKVKHIKQFLLISACIFFAGFNYFNYVKADDIQSGSAKICDKAIDADCDGLTNAEEKLYGTKPNNPDTDGDGYSDGVEVKSGYDPLVPAPGDKIVNSPSTSNQIQSDQKYPSSNTSLTDSFISDYQNYTASMGDKEITASDAQSFMNTAIAEKTGPAMTWDTLPQVDKTQIKILDQSYPSLNATNKKNQEALDANNYLLRISYLLSSNAPMPAETNEEVSVFWEDFQGHLLSLSSANPDLEYFNDLGDRLDLFLNQANEITVPETMLDLHIKFLRLCRGALSLREMGSFGQGPIEQMALNNKIQNLTNLLADFLQNDFSTFFIQFQNTQK